MSEQQKPVPFLIAMPRSGTTLLRLMLDAHPELAIPPETDFVPRVLGTGASAESFLRAVVDHWRWPDLGLDEEELALRLARVDPFTVAEALRTVYGAYAEQFGKRRFGDKSPSHRWHMTAVAELLPEVRFVHVIRDGRDVALSIVPVWFGPDTIERAAMRWREDVIRTRETGASLPHYAEVRFEDLVLRPEATLTGLCEYLDLPWRAEMLEYHEGAAERLSEIRSDARGADGSVLASGEERRAMFSLATRPPQQDRVGRWRREMSAADRRRVESVAGELLAELGYDL